MEILVGCDPEVFVKQNGVFKSAHGLVKGTKDYPFPVSKGAVQVDGMALEFNINPAKNEDDFCLNVQTVFDELCKMVPGYEVVATPVAHFDELYMKSQPQEALELGCDPDYNAYLGVANERPDGNRPMRTASGHVHIGWTNGQYIEDHQHREDAFMSAKMMDFYLGLPSLAYDKDVERRGMYGKAGCCRIKPYGVEYRTLSNAWLRSEKLMRQVYRNTVAGMERLMKGDLLWEKYPDIQNIINSSNVKEALKICKKEGIEVCYG